MAKSKKTDSKDEQPKSEMPDKTEAKSDEKTAQKVVVINRTRSEIVVEAAGAGSIEVVRAGERLKGRVITLPGTPKFELQPKTTIFSYEDWLGIEKNPAVGGMIAAGQIEVH